MQGDKQKEIISRFISRNRYDKYLDSSFLFGFKMHER